MWPLGMNFLFSVRRIPTVDVFWLTGLQFMLFDVFCNFAALNGTIRFAQMSAESYVETPISGPAKFVLAPFSVMTDGQQEGEGPSGKLLSNTMHKHTILRTSSFWLEILDASLPATMCPSRHRRFPRTATYFKTGCKNLNLVQQYGRAECSD